jgi:ribosomal-protein-alanine N-acetyltransferase
MKLTTERLILRNYKTEDWERVHIYGSDPDFSKYEFWGPNTVEDTQKFISDMIQQAQVLPLFQFHFAISLKENDLLIGGCSLRRETELSQVANLGWAITPEFQNMGFATEAAGALVEYGFRDLKLSVIYATCDTRNISSYKVMEKLGMKRVGLIKGTKEVKGYIRDTYRYELLSPDLVTKFK